MRFNNLRERDQRNPTGNVNDVAPPREAICLLDVHIGNQRHESNVPVTMCGLSGGGISVRYGSVRFSPWLNK